MGSNNVQILGPSWSSSYGSWIYNYLCNQQRSLSQLDQLLPALELSTLSCSTQQHIACFTENNWAPQLIMPPLWQTVPITIKVVRIGDGLV